MSLFFSFSRASHPPFFDLIRPWAGRLELKRILSGATNLIRAIYDADSASLFERDPDEDGMLDDDESQSQAVAR